MTGKRAFVRFDNAGNPQLFKSDQKVRIELAVPPSTNMPKVTGALHNIFLGPNEPLASFPAYWQVFFEKQNKGKASGQAKTTSAPQSRTWIANSRALRVAGKIVPPHATFTPDPSYDRTSRSYGAQGTTILWCVVNEQGAAEDIQIVKPLGMGLDERAVEAVAKWRFRPAMKDGKAVPVQINIQVNFRLN